MSNLLPTETFSVGRFCSTAADLLQSDDAAPFVRFVLNGQYNGYQAVLDPILDRVRPSETPTLQLRRDYDSVLGISDNICVRSNEIYVYPLPRFEESLTKDVHIKYEFDNNSVRRFDPSLSYHHLQCTFRAIIQRRFTRSQTSASLNGSSTTLYACCSSIYTMKVNPTGISQKNS